MITIKDINPDAHLSAYIAVTFAKEVLPIFEEEHPEDLGPRKAIEVAEAYLRGEEVSAAAYDAARDAASASNATAADAAYAAYAARSAACAFFAAYCQPISAAVYYAASAASSAAAASYSAAAVRAASAARSVYAAHAAAAASNAAVALKEEYIHERLLKMFPYIFQYKIDNQQSFNNAEKVLEYLNEEQQTVALFHLDSLIGDNKKNE